MRRTITFEQLRRLVNESDGELDKSFKPDVEWMKEKYDEMNKRLFNGRLGDCTLQLFTTGKGSQGNVLGWFCMNSGKSLKADPYSRKMFVVSPYGERTYITSGNFVDVCVPTIKLNGNYTGTEHAFLGTLVHEMCHYYTYMDGFCPKQAHGREFRAIGEIVSNRSNGEFTIQRLANAEQMSEYELSDEMKVKKERRMSNKKASTCAVFVWKSGIIELLMVKSSNTDLIKRIETVCSEKDVYQKMLVSYNSNVIDYLFGKGYDSVCRKWKYWDIATKPWLSELWDLVFTDNFEWWVDKEPEKMVGEDSNDSDDDSIAIPSGMNLSQMSPLEI